ncbi:probable G-protein coupled receptor 139 [Mobula birostris]|uniref:probable G-protein coupled receptor 139 n=1 Tax=Mobula birostris TaxID=1983395 RepID=UPI003B27C6AC
MQSVVSSTKDITSEDRTLPMEASRASSAFSSSSTPLISSTAGGRRMSVRFFTALTRSAARPLKLSVFDGNLTEHLVHEVVKAYPSRAAKLSCRQNGTKISDKHHLSGAGFLRVKLTFLYSFAVNLVAILILCLGNCGLSKCICRYLVGMAAADLLGVIIAVIISEINNIYGYAFPLLITPVCAVTHVLRITTMDCSVWLTVAFTFDRCIAICSQELRERYCTERTATIVIVIVVLGSCAKCVPFYFAVEPYLIIDNVPWRCILKAEYIYLPIWKAFQLFHIITAPSLAIGLILLFNALTVSHIIAANRVRRGLRNSSEKKNDPELENRKKSIILLFALSANFILLWIPYIAYTMNWQVQNYFYTDRYLNTPTYILQQFGFMLQFLCTCTNTCIYTLSQRKFREELKGGVKYLVTLNRRLCR